MRCIITGATGFIGTALCRDLLESGHEVMAVIRPGSTKKEKLHFEDSPADEQFINKLCVIELPLEQLSELSDHIEKADVFYHLAWNGSAGAEREDFNIQYTNIGYTAEAIRAAVKCGCKKFIGAGSQAEYGVMREKAKEYETVPHPFMMYGAAKLAAYHMGKLVAGQEGISFVWPRIYSIYGVGENDGTLVSYVVKCLKKGEVPLLSPCENMWNFLEITDCVRALRLLGEIESTEGIYHVASQESRLLREFMKEIRDIIAPESELGFGVKKSDTERTFWLEPDVERIRGIGFREKVSFGEGIRRKADRS